MADQNDDMLEDKQDENTKKLLASVQMGKGKKVKRDDMVQYLELELVQRTSFLKLPFTVLYFAIYASRVLMHEKIGDSSMVQREFRSMLTGTTYEGIQYTSGHKDIGDIDVADDIWTFMNEVVLPMFIQPYGVEDPHRVLRYNQIIGGIQFQQVRRQLKDCSDEYPALPPYDSTGANPLLKDYACYPFTTTSDDCYGENSNGDTPQWLGKNMEGWCPDSKTFTSTTRRLNSAFNLGSDRKMIQALGRDLRRAEHGWPTKAEERADEARRLDFVPDGGGKGGASKGPPGKTLTADDTFSVYFYENEGVDEAKRKLQMIKQNNWIDVNTAWVGIRMLILNPDMGMFVHITVHVYFVPSGALLPHLTAQSFTPEPYQFKSVIAMDACFGFLVFVLFLRIMKRAVTALKAGQIRDFFRKPYTWLDISIFMGGCVIGLMWFMLMGMLDAAKAKAMAVRVADVTADSYPAKVAALHAEMNVISSYLMTYRLIMSWYTIMTSMKFLESFSAQPRLAVVTETIIRAGSDLFHFLCVLVTLFMSFTVAGMFLFGRRIWNFASLDQATIMCFRMLLGDFDWGELSEEHFVTTQLWFLLFIILMMLLMLNMLMAIIMDKYTEVKSDADDSKMIWTQTYDMIVEKVQVMKGSRIPLHILIQTIKDIAQEEIDEASLIEACEGKLTHEIAAELMQFTKTKSDNALNKGVDISSAMKMIGWVKIAVHKIGWKLAEIMDEERQEHNLLTAQNLAAGQTGATAAAHQTQIAKLAGPVDDDSGKFLTDKDGLLDELEGRMGKMEQFIDEAMKFSSFRGKDLRNRLSVIEDLIRSQHDVSMLRVERDVWDAPPPRLGQN